ncbi:tRNA (adenosine(37)-N6)-dimethylallyltransferase MiaA [Pedobacter insulae]|uniref:tRNA dimethylallyltransferase n=1 Tax=Pedobacter insulae TaxID=414048 RepID=A0A1I2UHQ5_9SPHI|nr:tRNA (adenosine(37)-N6)-dimethylallyltransferase MiaA [Pedobacter insulae]SFG76694.1 tRNA dimethylallyltransferase [Pedobacter insulae]
MEQDPLLVILGATASGKTRLAIALAETLATEIISADSRQVFRGMDIGTGKDLAEFNQAKIPFHLIDIREAGESYHVNAFKEDFYAAFRQISEREKIPILVGGTGMYIHSLLQNYEYTAVPKNEELRLALQDFDRIQLLEQIKSYPANLVAHADLSSTKRLIRAIEVADYLKGNTLKTFAKPSINPLVIGLVDELSTRRAKISNRLDLRLKEGLIEEVEMLIARGVSLDKLIFYGLEYKFVALYLMKQIDYQTLKERLTVAIFQFAKRQMTFFRKMEKDGVKIHWLKADKELFSLKAEALELINHHIQLK